MSDSSCSKLSESDFELKNFESDILELTDKEPDYYVIINFPQNGDHIVNFHVI